MASGREGTASPSGSSSTARPTRSPAPPTRSALPQMPGGPDVPHVYSRTWATTSARRAVSSARRWTSPSRRWRSSGSTDALRDPDAFGQSGDRDPAAGRAHRLRRRGRDRILVRARRPARHAAESLASVVRLRPPGDIDADGSIVVLAFAKNPTSYNTTLRALAAEGEPRQLLIAASNTLVDGEDFGWLWDVDFELMAPQSRARGRLRPSGGRAGETGSSTRACRRAR